MPNHTTNFVTVGTNTNVDEEILALQELKTDLNIKEGEFDFEGIIIDYKPGKGKYENLLGGFVCKPLINHDTYMTVDEDESHIFTLSGMDDKVRKNYKRTHPVGTIITCECSGFTDKGVPRFGRYLRKRTDVVLKDSDSNSSEKLEQII